MHTSKGIPVLKLPASNGQLQIFALQAVVVYFQIKIQLVTVVQFVISKAYFRLDMCLFVRAHLWYFRCLSSDPHTGKEKSANTSKVGELYDMCFGWQNGKMKA